MAKKKLISLITLTMLLLTGCGEDSSSVPDSVDDRDTRIIEVYDAYKANGGTLDYDTWLSSIRGEKGDKGDKGDDAITYVPVIFNNWDGTKLYEFYFEKGTNAVYEGETPTHPSC